MAKRKFNNGDRCSDRFLFKYVIKMKRKKYYCGGTVSKFLKKGERDKMTARIPGLIQGLQ
jgi:hypothetical protein